ncbi:lasso RiPP family leader peptide-containing protein [Streptomyces sp. NPDC050636]
MREMQETQEAPEQVDYEAPELAEVGGFTELTLGFVGILYDGIGGFSLD